jgi:hypothetical protein
MGTPITKQTLRFWRFPRWALQPFYTHSRSKTRTFGFTPLAG